MKGKKITVVLLILVLGIVYSIILFDTNSVIDDFKDCIKNAVVSDTVKESMLYNYYNCSDVYEREICDANVNIIRLLVCHNFHKGVMFVKYDCETLDSNGEHIYGGSNIYAKWYIRKENGRWIVYKIHEDP